jgi:hypothetical protein
VTASRFTLIVVVILLPLVLAEALPDGVSSALAIVGVITAVVAIFPPFVGLSACSRANLATRSRTMWRGHDSGRADRVFSALALSSTL